MRSVRTFAAGVVVAGLSPLVAAPPAAAATVLEDFEAREVTFRFGGSPRTCHIWGASRYEYADGEASISASTAVADEPGCREPVYQVSLLGQYETSPGSGQFRSFYASSGVGESPRPGTVSVQFEVAGPTGPVTVDHRVDIVCDGPTDPSLCSYQITTTPK